MGVHILSTTENKVTASMEKQVEVVEEIKLPVPTATGNDKVAVLNHHLSEIQTSADGVHRSPPGLELAIRNVSTSTIASMMFEAVLFDQSGNILETIKHKEIALEPDRSRAIQIPCSYYDHERVRSYVVRVIRTTSADVEKVQLRRHSGNTSETGEEEITGVVKNLSHTRTDAAIVATFYDKEEHIGTKVLVLKDLEPEATRQYQIRFKPQEGDRVSRYTLEVGELAD